VIPILAPQASDVTAGPTGLPEPPEGSAASERANVRAAPSGGLVNAYRLVTHERPTWRESVIGSSFLVTAGAAALAAAALVIGLRRHLRQHA
jgi:hypothetical protein